jgi:hypothetical protein
MLNMNKHAYIDFKKLVEEKNIWFNLSWRIVW